MYFAYGSNMSSSVVGERVSGARFQAVACLHEHRLAFTRHSERRGGGVADILPSQGFCLYGLLFTMPLLGLESLDRAEGAPTTYRRTDVTCFVDDRAVQAVTYQVVDPAPHEFSPSDSYLGLLLAGVREHQDEFPATYIRFLEYLARSFAQGYRNDGLLVSGTSDRRRSAGAPLIRVNRELPGTWSSTEYAALTIPGVTDKWAFGRVERTVSVPKGYCQVDQTIRSCLGLAGVDCFGHRVQIDGAHGDLPVRSPIAPRSIILPLQAISRLDSEKNYCVMHLNSMRSLGVEEGDSVRLYVTVRDRTNGFQPRIRSVSKRVSSGTEATVNRFGKTVPYPRPTEVYLDRECRSELGIPEAGWRGTPVLIRPDLIRALIARSFFYGITILLGIPAFFELLRAFAPGVSGVEQGLLALGLSLVLTAVVSILDLRGRLRY